jgi:hypothetical protein
MIQSSAQLADGSECEIPQAKVGRGVGPWLTP